MSEKITVVAVSYMNTFPFIYGLQHSEYLQDKIDLQLEIPSVCAQKLSNGTADLGLIPVAAIPEIPSAHIVSDYCIGAEKQVRSVLLASDVPLNAINQVFLDYQSRTSVNLAKVLAANFWDISPRWLETQAGYEEKIAGHTAGVVIGDRTFNRRIMTLPFRFDLAAEWYQFSGLPFVFAAWVSNKPLDRLFVKHFNTALQWGLAHLPRVAEQFRAQSLISETGLIEYLTHNISYLLDDNKRRGMEYFLELKQEV